jgi:hypothetical protein
VVIKGRIQAARVEAFFEELRSSRSRTCTLALLRRAPTCLFPRSFLLP